ncbi:protein of unknown function [Zhouia amylolytica]|uniref:DUF4834 domain-containing protein n=2 Tax=Zhouia amylolytica TaxID=376730 RepID=W2UQU6_9FLAO|nr:DUF4834 family protein [Zhouia amylolytica]ETN96309.1 hypothetical protein P278_08200 [Zhouia amylolytica AD3]MCQ0112201.1 DUF4834 family protein [Zhouia amylolytica]SFS87191.1 protein of unknown function [Zhouia amylolytica]
MDVLIVLLTILLIYFGLKVLGRVLAPFLLKYISKKMEKKFREGFGQYQQQATYKNEQYQTKEGETVIDKKPTRNKKNTSKSSKKVGEYIDFEELD